MTDKFILASASPRRKALLEQAGLRFEVIPSEINESDYQTDGFGATEFTRILAKAKAIDVAVKHPSRLVLAADCVVSIGEDIIGKPKDIQDAERIIRMIFAEPHEVITSICFIAINDGIELLESESTIVYPKQLTDSQISAYLASNKWQGKAGAYGIQDEQSDEFIEKIEGSYSNVMGLPLETTLEILDEIYD